MVNENYEPVQDLKEEDLIDKPAKGCRADAPTLSVGDFRVNNSNWLPFKKSNKIFILSISNSNCEKCCQDEPLLRFLQGSMRNNTYSYKGKKVPIARIDTKDKLKFMEKEGFNFDEYPKMFIYFEG